MHNYSSQVLKIQDVIYQNGIDHEAHLMFKASNNMTLGSQINIYRNNYYTTLAGNIDNNFPNLKKYLGNQCFENIRDQYIVTNDSNATLNLYPVGFGEHIAKNINDIFACDIAKIESAKIKVNWCWENRQSFLNYYQFSDWPYKLALKTSNNVVMLELNSLADDYIIGGELNLRNSTKRYVLLYKGKNNVLMQEDLHEIEYFIITKLNEGILFSEIMELVPANYDSIEEEIILEILGKFIPKMLKTDALVVEGEHVI
jgi:hypothetical protein